MKDKIIEFLKNNAPVSLTIISAYGYFCAYVYQYGYFKYFKLPVDFIEVQLNEVLAFIFSFFLVVASLLFWLEKILLLNTSYGTRRFLINTTLKTIGLGCIVFILVINVTNLSLFIYEILFFIIIGLCIAFIFWEYLFIRKIRKIKNLEEKDIIEEAKKVLIKNPAATVDDVIESIKQKTFSQKKAINENYPVKERKYLSEFGNLIWIASVILLICFGLGYSNASRLKSFVSFRKHPTIFIIKKYGENMICKNYNFKENGFGDSILLYKTSDTSNNIFIEQKIK